MKTKLLIIASCALLLLAAGCKNQPETLGGSINKPAWQKPAEYDYSSSMTAVVKIDLLKDYPSMAMDWHLRESDLLAAFIGDKCCGVASYNQVDSLFYLFIADAADPALVDKQVTLRYWSAYYRNLFLATNVFPFVNDGQKGNADAPFVPVFVVEKREK